MLIKKTLLFLFWLVLGLNNAYALALNKDLQKIVKDGKLTVAFVTNPPSPYVSFDDAHQLQGFDVELANQIAQALDVKLEPVYAADFNAAIAMVANKQAELVISNITRTYERGKYVLFSRPYNTGYLTVIESRTNATATDITRNNMINKYNQSGYIIGVQEGTVFSDVVKEYFPLATIASYKDDKQILLDISAKKINAAITDNVVGKSLVRKFPELSLSVTTTKVKDWGLEDAIVMNMDDLYLLYWINLFLEIHEQDGSLKRMRAHYFDSNKVVQK